MELFIEIKEVLLAILHLSIFLDFFKTKMLVYNLKNKIFFSKKFNELVYYPLLPYSIILKIQENNHQIK